MWNGFKAMNAGRTLRSRDVDRIPADVRANIKNGVVGRYQRFDHGRFLLLVIREVENFHRCGPEIAGRAAYPNPAVSRGHDDFAVNDLDFPDIGVGNEFGVIEKMRMMATKHRTDVVLLGHRAVFELGQRVIEAFHHEFSEIDAKKGFDLARGKFQHFLTECGLYADPERVVHDDVRIGEIPANTVLTANHVGLVCQVTGKQ